MMLQLHVAWTNRFIREEVFGDNGSEYFWGERFLPRWIPLLIGLVLAVAVGFFVARGDASLAIPLAVAVPSVVVLLRYPLVAVMIWLLISPFTMEQSSAVNVIIYWALQRALIPVALGIVVLGDWLNLRKRQPVRFGTPEIIMVVFLFIALVNILVLNDTEPRSLVRFYDFVVIPFCSYWLIRQFAPTRNDLRYLAWVAFFVVITQVVIGLMGWFAPHTLPAYWVQMAGERTTGTFRNPDPYAITLAFMSLLLLQYGMQSNRHFVRFAALFTVGFGLFGTFFTFSRASWLGAVAVLVALMLVYPRVTLGLIVGMALLISFLGNTVLTSEMEWVQTRFTEGRQIDNRIVVYVASLQMVQEKPVFGWGFGNHNVYVERFKGRVGDIPEEAGEQVVSHNSSLTIMAEMGLPGFFIYWLPVLWWFLTSVKVWRHMPRGGFLGRSWLVILWLALLEQFIVSNFNDLFSHFYFVTVLWWMFLGLIANLVSPYVERKRFHQGILPEEVRTCAE